MTDLAARLAQRARPLAEAPAMVPYLPDRPADPRIGPESPLAEFGGFGDAEALGGEVIEGAVEGTVEVPWSVGKEPSRGLQPGRQDPERAPSILPAPAGELGRRIDHAVDPGEQPREVIYQESRVAERLLERVHTDTVHTHAATPPAVLDRSPGRARLTAPAEPASEALHPRSSDRPGDAPRLTPERSDRVDARSGDPSWSPMLSRETDDEPGHVVERTPAERAPLAPAFEPPRPTPAPARLRPRERPLTFDAPLVELDPPTIHIGSITVEVIQTSPRADARRVQAPPDRPQRAAAAKPSARSSRPLRTFGLRQL